MAFSYPDAILKASGMLGAKYLLGGKWSTPALGNSCDCPTCVGPIDCSGFASWVLSIAGVTLPDGSYNQIKVCEKLPASLQADPPALALGFFAGDGVTVDHVVISMGAGVVIEARGEPYNQVIFRPVAAWNAQAGFLGWFCPPGLNLSAPGTP